MSVIFPNARFGIVHRLGEIMTADRRNGIELMVISDMVVMHIWKDGAKFYTIDMNAMKATDIADFLNKGAAMIMRGGGSGLPKPVNSKPTVLHR